MPQNVCGLGVDIVSVGRIAALWQRHGESFLARVLSEEERRGSFDDPVSMERLAGRWAAKEAVAKALGSGFRGFNMSDVEIYNDAHGRPYVVLQRGAAERAQESGIASLLLSISHEKEMAIAEAIALCE